MDMNESFVTVEQFGRLIVSTAKTGEITVLLPGGQKVTS